MDELLEAGIRLFNHRHFFECHEVLEEAWTPERGPRKLFLQALIHFAVAFYHYERRNRAGAVRQLRKGIRKLGPYLPANEGIDTERLHRDALAALERIEAGDEVSDYPQIHRLTQALSKPQ